MLGSSEATQRLCGKISDGCGMLREQRFEFRQELRHFGFFSSRGLFAEFFNPVFNPVFNGIDFHKYEHYAGKQRAGNTGALVVLHVLSSTLPPANLTML